MRNESMVFRQMAIEVLVAPECCGLHTVPDLVTHVRAWCVAPMSETLVLDLSEVAEVETTVVRSILWARCYCRSNGVDLAVALPPPGVLSSTDERLLRTHVRIATAAPAAAPASDDLVDA